MDNHGNYIKGSDPIMGNQEFYDTIMEIYNRLKSNGLLDDSMDQITTVRGSYNLIASTGINDDKHIDDFIEEFQLTPDKNIKYAGILTLSD